MADKEKDPWEALRNNLSFFKKTEVPEDLFDLPNYSNVLFYRTKHDECMKRGNVWFARFWASAYLDRYVSFKWNADVAVGRADGLVEKKAWIAADKLKEEFLKELGKKYA